MGFRFLAALILVAFVSSGCVVIVNYTGDAEANIDVLLDLDAKVATEAILR